MTSLRRWQRQIPKRVVGVCIFNGWRSFSTGKEAEGSRGQTAATVLKLTHCQAACHFLLPGTERLFQPFNHSCFVRLVVCVPVGHAVWRVRD